MDQFPQIPLHFPFCYGIARNRFGRGFVSAIATPPGVHFTPLPHEATPLTIGPSTTVSLPGAQDPASTPVWPPYAPYSVRLDTPVPMVAQLLPATDWTPGTFPALPQGASVPFHVHPHLIYNPNNPSLPILQWDVLHSAEVARVYTGRHSVLPVDLKAEAIFPVVKRVYIVTDHDILARWMERWGPIVAEADKITVRDILDAIHNYFEQPLTPRDIDVIKEIPGNYAALRYSAEQRVAESYELASSQLRAGFKRVDAIGGHRRFQGLRPVVYQNRTWKLFLGLLPGPVPTVY